MHEQFSDRARHAMALASREANRLGHDYIGPEHILLGIVAQGECVASTVLAHLGVDLYRVRQELDRQIEAGHGQPEIGRRPYNRETRAVIEYAISEARKLGHKYVGTEHLLLGLLHVQNNLAARILIAQGVGLDPLREEVLTILRAASGPKHDTSARSFGEFEWIHQQELAKGFRSPAFWHMLILAVDSANRLGQGEIRAEHLLLAMLRDPGNPVCAMLAEKGVTADWVRERLTQSENASSASDESP
jgi:ATP-dependent Clp protease ATP-binding subunit ClpA